MATINELAPNTAPVNGQGGDHQGRLAHLPSDLLPKEIVGPIFEKAQESSLVLRMGQQIPVTYGETIIPVNTKRPEVGQVGTGTSNEQREGAQKPLSGVGWGSRSFSPIKLATIVTVSEEFARANVNGLYTQIQSDLAYAIGRGIDLAVFHGKQPLSGANLQGIDRANVLAETTNSVDFGADPVEDLLAGYDLVSVNHEFSGWAADPRYRGRLARAMVVRDVNGNVADPGALNLATQNSSLLGFPIQFGRAVGGDLGAATDSNIRLIGGDFSQLRFGYADQVRVKVTDQATLTDGTQTISMWQTNQLAILIEVTFGWVVGDLDAFVKFNEVPPAPPVEG
ncbi:phage major capsid protein [Saccharopolyspora indica]|uniref:phage major capsid protein n=1 Tax=Saccharopolyspora indica TaxID=1229659 RepID=UPI0022EA5B70|nr:phage major capsid protein [Saccharopolyspora indica]MDA3643786.1 phage major capsid protein [Saccharopolyspora indica]